MSDLIVITRIMMSVLVLSPTWLEVDLFLGYL